MALQPSQQSSRLFKKSLGVAETITTKEFFSEGKLGRTSVVPNQIWSESNLIPNTAPILPDGGISGVVEFHSSMSLSFITGSVSGGRDVSYSGETLKNAIPFNYGDGSSYGYKLYTSVGAQIFDGVGDWLVDGEAGVLTFYTPANMPAGVSSASPPKISFYKYIGNTGLTSITADISAEISARISGDTSLSAAISGLTTSISSTFNSLSSSISGDISSSNASLSTAISGNISSADSSLSTAISINISSGNVSLSSAISINISNSDTSLSTTISTTISTEASDRISGDTSLTTKLSTEISERNSADASLSSALLSVAYDSAFNDSLVVSDVGGIKAPTNVGQLTGKTFSELFDMLLFQTILAYVGTTNSAGLTGYNGTSPVQVGTTYAPATTGSYVRGTIYDGNGVLNSNPLTGIPTGYTFYYITTGGTITDANYTTGNLTQANTYTSRSIALGSNTWRVSVTYNIGTGTYYDNKGNPGSNLVSNRAAGTRTFDGTVQGQNKAFWGINPNTTITGTDVVAFSTNILATGYVRTINYANGNSQYLYYCYPSRFAGTPTFTYNSLPTTFILQGTNISVTNDTSYTEDYTVWRSLNTQSATNMNIVIT